MITEERTDNRSGLILLAGRSDIQNRIISVQVPFPALGGDQTGYKEQCYQYFPVSQAEQIQLHISSEDQSII